MRVRKVESTKVPIQGLKVSYFQTKSQNKINTRVIYNQNKHIATKIS